MKVGIDAISFYTPRYYLDLKTLAAVRGVDAEKYYKGLGQERMAICPPDEDVVTMAASAAREVLEGEDLSCIDCILFATESGIDQSKAAAIYVHKLLDLPSSCKALELKQACCSGMAGLVMTIGQVALRPDKKILLVCSDVARYGLATAGEATTGAGAVAVLLSANPRLLEIGPEHGCHTQDVMDFWRPNYTDEAYVDGKLSIRVYIKALAEAWNGYVKESGCEYDDFYRFCYHMPFTRMAEKAHMQLAKYCAPDRSKDYLLEQLFSGQRYNRLTGNTYTASVFIGLCSLLESHEKLAGKRVGIFSYGSGSMGLFLGATVCVGYENHLHRMAHRKMLESRHELPFGDYEVFYRHQLPKDGSAYECPQYETGVYRLAGIDGHKRHYENTSKSPESSSDKGLFSKSIPLKGCKSSGSMKS